MMVGIVGMTGCGGGSTCASGSTDGTGGGHVCTWDGTGGGTQIPDCSDRLNSAHLVGTLAGKPFDTSYDYAYVDEIPDDEPGARQKLSLQVYDKNVGIMIANWLPPTPVGVWFDVMGYFTLPNEPFRNMLPGTKIRHQCNTHRYQFILVFEDGQLTGCSGP
jgi:hypothetical protein